MRTFTHEQFDELIADAPIQPRLKRELKFEAAAASIHDQWYDTEIVAVADRSGAKGIILMQPDESLFMVQYELSPLPASSTTGRARSIICDFCYTWQRGSNAGSITLVNRATKRSVGYLCCGDLACSANVRSTTEAARVSRTQLREDLDDDGRVARLKDRLHEKIADLGLLPVEND